ncbi:MAG TPA: MFS transporter [Acidobacteriota bacterium]|nr:MFS transporter [Acidobacteriota bacterium]
MVRNNAVVGLVFFIFFVISLLTNIIGPLIPNIIDAFKLSLVLAGFLPFAFFIAYGPMSIPAGILLEKFTEKPVLIASFAVALAASFFFATMPVFQVALVSFFSIGIGMAMLQVAINPLLRTAGGEEHFAFFSVLGQLVFGLASYISPQIYSYLVTNLKEPPANDNWLISSLRGLVPPHLPWVSLYWVFAAVCVFMIVVLVLFKLPKVELKEDEKTGAKEIYLQLFKNRTVILFFIGIFAYVGTEQGIANWISEFLRRYHGLRPEVDGAQAVSWFWGFMTVGCAVGLVLLKLFDSRSVLIGASVLAIGTLTVALFGPVSVSKIAFASVGFCASVMWSIVFSLALNSLDKHHGSFSGILCTGIVGGAVVPLVIGWLGDMVGLRYGMFVLYLTLGYILSIGFWARPLITNATILKKTPAEAAKV